MNQEKFELNSKIAGSAGDVGTPQFQTLVEMLRQRARDEPDRTAYIYLIEGETESPPITYGQLDRQARALASRLREFASRGDRAALLYQHGVEFMPAFFGCLYSGIIAVPVPSVFSSKALPTLQTILGDAAPKVVLTTEALLPRVKTLIESGVNVNVSFMATDEAPDSAADDWEELSVGSSDLAYLQYTSGSTSNGKGVMITHHNCVHNLEDMDRFVTHQPGTASVTWLPYFHDMGLVYGLLEPLYKGLPCYVMSPQSFIQQPRRWLKAISRYRATHSGGPNFAYEYCVDRIKPEQCEGLDLSCWEVAFNGSEPIRKQTLDRFYQTFAPFGFKLAALCPCYGLAEATLVVSCAIKEEPPASCVVLLKPFENKIVQIASEMAEGTKTLLASGLPASSTRIAIVDPESFVCCPPDGIGEVWVCNDSVAIGYWNRPVETEQTFHAYTADTKQGPFLRTGDLGFIADGQLYITGRIKDLIIIGGRNHYPQDIEVTVQTSHPSIRAGACVAISVEVHDQECLVIAAEIDHHYECDTQSLDPPGVNDEIVRADVNGQHPTAIVSASGRRRAKREQVIASIKEAVASKHGIRPHNVVLLRVGAIPRTTSGKLKRLECRKKYLGGNLSLWESSTAASNR